MRFIGLSLVTEQLRLPPLRLRLADHLFLQQKLSPRIGLFGNMESGPRLQIR
jgi:hypothetical protein